MGKAIIISDVNFSSANLGKVTLSGNIPLVALAIDTSDYFRGTSIQMDLIRYPINTTEREVSWSITSGNQFATIDSSTGLLTINPSANEGVVTVMVSSVDNPAIKATKNITVSYNNVNGVALRNKLIGDGNAFINTLYMLKSNSKIYIDYEVNEIQTGVSYLSLWGAYTSESEPLSRHLLDINEREQLIQFGASSSTSKTGVRWTDSQGLPVLESRRNQTTSMLEFVSSTAQQDFIKNTGYDGTFTAPLTPVGIFTTRTGSLKPTENSCTKMSLYEFQIIEDDSTIVKKMVPCLLTEELSQEYAWDGQRHSAGESGLWDTTNNIFYGNANTIGSFSTE